MNSQDLISKVPASNNSSVVNPQRRALLGSATTGTLVAAAAAGALATLGSNRAEASPALGWYDAKIDFGATGNGSTDDTAALQNAINAASGISSSGGVLPLYIPPGTYKITSPLVVPRYIKVFGAGRTYSTIIKPQGCGLFAIDGSLYSGGWVMGILISDITAELKYASTTNAAIYINKAYNVCIRDCFFIIVAQTLRAIH